MFSLVLSVTIVSAPAPLPKRQFVHDVWPVGKWVSIPDGYYVVVFNRDGSYAERTGIGNHFGRWHYESKNVVVARYNLVGERPIPTYRATYYKKDDRVEWTGIPFYKVK